jgi:hypothetical protein
MPVSLGGLVLVLDGVTKGSAMFRRVVVALAAIAVLSAVIMVPSIASGGTGPRYQVVDGGDAPAGGVHDRNSPPPPTFLCSSVRTAQPGCWDCGGCAACKG